jgi:uncharacterized protein with HEPN domain
MSDRPIEILLLDIHESCEKIEKYVSNIDFVAFQQNSMVREAVERNIEIIGEACNKIPEDFKSKHNEIEWHKPIGMRNRLIHGYFSTDVALLWNTATVVVPFFRNQILNLLP